MKSFKNEPIRNLVKRKKKNGTALYREGGDRMFTLVSLDGERVK